MSTAGPSSHTSPSGVQPWSTGAGPPTAAGL